MPTRAESAPPGPEPRVAWPQRAPSRWRSRRRYRAANAAHGPRSLPPAAPRRCARGPGRGPPPMSVAPAHVPASSSFHMRREIPERLNIADWLLDARIREGKGDRPALLTDQGTLTYREVQALANRFGHLLESAGVEPEQRVIIALPDGPEFVAALFGTLKVGGVVVMVNPQLAVDAIEDFYSDTRAPGPLVHRHTAPAFQAAQRGARHLKQIIV